MYDSMYVCMYVCMCVYIYMCVCPSNRSKDHLIQASNSHGSPVGLILPLTENRTSKPPGFW